MGLDCKYCGAYVSNGLDKCPACGKKVKTEENFGYAYAKAEEKEERREEKTQSYTYSYKEEYAQSGSTARENSESDKAAVSATICDDNADVRENRALCYLCYLGPLFIIPYLLKRDSDFVRFHSNQGLLLLIANVLTGFVGEIVPIIGWLISLIGGIYVFVSFIQGMMSVHEGKKKPLSVIGEIELLK